MHMLFTEVHFLFDNSVEGQYVTSTNKGLLINRNSYLKPYDYLENVSGIK